jgi:hypothetical protein
MWESGEKPVKRAVKLLAKSEIFTMGNYPAE